MGKTSMEQNEKTKSIAPQVANSIIDAQIIEAAQRADRIKSVMSEGGVSADAIFTAIILRKRGPGRPTTRKIEAKPESPAAWFDEALLSLKGQSLTIGQLMLYSNVIGASKADRNAVGRWLRATGRSPRKSRGRKLFDI